MITVWDILMFGTAFAIFSILFGFVEAAIKDLIKWLRKKPSAQAERDVWRNTYPPPMNCRCTAVPIRDMTKDLDDPRPTLGDLDPDLDAMLRGFSRRNPMSDEEQALAEAELETMKELCRAADEEDELLMELGDDTIEGYLNGGESDGR